MEDANSVCSFSRFCIGMCEWTDCTKRDQAMKLHPSSQPHPSKNQLLPSNLKLEPICSSSGHFEFASKKQLAEFSKTLHQITTLYPLNGHSKYSTSREKLGIKEDTDDYRSSAFECPTLRFAVETRERSMVPIILPPQSNKFCVDYNPDCPNFLDKQDSRFQQLHHTLDALFYKLHSEGIGVQVKHADILTKDDEAKSWHSGVMSATSSKSLQNAV